MPGPAAPTWRGNTAKRTQKPGWWDAIVGPGRLLDTDRYFVICANVIGSCLRFHRSRFHQPEDRQKIQSLLSGDHGAGHGAGAGLLIDHLGIDKLVTVLGGSMGGMQALEWATQFPDRIASAIVLAATARPSAQAIALNAVARWAIFNDPTWKKGEYRKNPKDGLALARGIGHITFLSDESMTAKFGRRFSARDGLFDFFGQFEVERYLSYNGYNFVDRFDANSFLYLAKALDLYDVALGVRIAGRGVRTGHGAAPVLCLLLRLALSRLPDRGDGEGPGETRQAGGVPPHRVFLRPRCLPAGARDLCADGEGVSGEAVILKCWKECP